MNSGNEWQGQKGEAWALPSEEGARTKNVLKPRS